LTDRHRGEEGGTAVVWKQKKVPKLDIAEAEEILKTVFVDCGEELNAAPMEELTSYSLYRKESFRLQRAVLLVALILFALVPGCFVQPEFETSYTAKGERGLPEYTITIKPLLPVKRVIAVIGGHRLPVYEVNGHEYTIEPTQNGIIALTVEFFNRQYVTGQLEVLNADVTAPRLEDYETKDGKYILTLADDGVGIDFASIYAMTTTGEVIYPESYDRDAQTVTFDVNLSGAQIFIPDYFSNILTLKLL
jgi:hypothetical protein